jgi:hypothetical protein
MFAVLHLSVGRRQPPTTLVGPTEASIDSSSGWGRISSMGLFDENADSSQRLAPSILQLLHSRVDSREGDTFPSFEPLFVFMAASLSSWLLSRGASLEYR